MEVGQEIRDVDSRQDHPMIEPTKSGWNMLVLLMYTARNGSANPQAKLLANEIIQLCLLDILCSAGQVRPVLPSYGHTNIPIERRRSTR